MLEVLRDIFRDQFSYRNIFSRHSAKCHLLIVRQTNTLYKGLFWDIGFGLKVEGKLCEVIWASLADYTT